MTFVRSRLASPLALRICAVLVAVLAAYGPRVGAVDAVRRVILIDRSESSDVGGVVLEELVSDLGDDDEVCIIDFAATAIAGECGPAVRTVRDLFARGLTAPEPHASDLAAAL